LFTTYAGDAMTDAIDPRDAALLVMDYQIGILDLLDDADPLLARVSEAIALVRGRGGQVVPRRRPDDRDPRAGRAGAGRHRRAQDPRRRLLDACADPDPELHAFLTGRIFPRQGDVVTIADLAELYVANR
jgi:hypothetical protein